MLNFNMGFTNYNMRFFYGSGMPAFNPWNSGLCFGSYLNSGFNSFPMMNFSPYSAMNFNPYSNVGSCFSSYNNFSSPYNFSSGFSSCKSELNNIFSYAPISSGGTYNPYSFYSSNSAKTNPTSNNIFSTNTIKSKTHSSTSIIKMSPDKAFNKALSFTFRAEGGYVNNPLDRGGATNMGMTQSTYDGYRKEKNLPLKSVTSLTKDEVTQIYYEKFWLGSGADKISNPKLAIAYYDAATLHGISKAKEFYSNSGGDLNKFLDLRRKHFSQIVANNSSQKVFLKGWNNRIDNLQNYLSNLA